MRSTTHIAAAFVAAATAAVLAQGAGPLPAGWHARLDNDTVKVTPGLVKEETDALIFSTGPAAGVYWKDDMKAEKDFVLSAVFSQLKTSARADAYGLFIGGKDLDKDTQRYVSFVVRQDGKFSIRGRNSGATRAIKDWTAAPSMVEPKGVKTSNTLQIRAAGTEVRFFVNDRQVHRMPRPQAGDGIAGLRVEQGLDVQVSQLALKKP
jgi:hypothetical protein